MASQKRSHHPARPFVIALLILSGIALFSFLRDFSGLQHLSEHTVDLSKRDEDIECRQVHQYKHDQCAFVKKNCVDEDAGLISYLNLYYCRLPQAKPLGFTLIATWTALLFTTIGVAASDFFCINLSTISGILGMSESMAGVTFLAFGNGSPDVFSTFAAMKSHSGSLAIGELIGAASFITAVVAASMALVRPFKVARRSFIRDVCFFIVAIAFSMFFLANGKLELWECAVMVGFYIFYVVVVVSWHWYLGRRRKRREVEAAARGHYIIPGLDELEVENEYHDDEDEDAIAGSRPSYSRTVTNEDLDDLERADRDYEASDTFDDAEEEEARQRWMGELSNNMRVTRPSKHFRSRSSTLNPIRPSLVGALEFQSVLKDLNNSRNIQTMPINLRRYSDDPNFTASQQQEVYSSSPDLAVGLGGHDTKNDASMLDPKREINGHEYYNSRARAVSANDADGLHFDRDMLARSNSPGKDLLGTSSTEHWSHERPLIPTIKAPSRGNAADHRQMAYPSPTSPLLSVSPPPPEGGRSRAVSPAPNRSRASTGEFLAPPGMEAPTHRRRPPSQRGVSPARHTQSPPIMSPQLRPRLRISPPPSKYDFETSRSPRTLHNDTGGSGSVSPSFPSLHIPAPSISPESLYPEDVNVSKPDRPLMWWPHRFLPPPTVIMRTMFPTLQDWRSKKLWEKLLGLASAPSFFLLTITLPVVEPDEKESNVTSIDDVLTSKDPTAKSPLLPHSPAATHPHHVSVATEAVSMEQRHHHVGSQNARNDLEAETAPVSANPLDRVDSSDVPKDWNRWLVILQCFTAPLFIILILWSNMEDMTARDLAKMSLWCLPGSSVAAAFVIFTTTPMRAPKWHFLLCFVGFAVSVAWISTIANEVVGVLKTIGVIFNMSDAILGLTIFAVGNSLGDLVADVTVARLGYPVMALSACFGGPMLNILLGVGISGLYMVISSEEKYHRKHPTKKPRFKPYQIEVSWTLLISAIALLVTLLTLLVLVPLNKWRMDRRIGLLLVIIWVAATVVNVVIEVTGVAGKFS